MAIHLTADPLSNFFFQLTAYLLSIFIHSNANCILIVLNIDQLNMSIHLTADQLSILISSTGRDQSSLCDTLLSVCPSVRLSVRPSVRLSVCPSVNNSCYRISSEDIYHRDFFIVPVCWPYGVVVHLRL